LKDLQKHLGKYKANLIAKAPLHHSFLLHDNLAQVWQEWFILA